MNCALCNRQRRFFDGLRQGRMGVAGAGQILGRAAEFHDNSGLSDDLSGVRANDMNPKDPVCFGVGQNFNEAVS